MKESYKSILAIVLLLSIGALFMLEILPSLENFNSTSYDYFTANTYEEVGSKNMVTGIYLDYRLFDSLLEAGILFIVTAGVLFMSKKDEEVR
tara:strand:- start:547 stop:822 length:276 start_codon:yes stop_codon:yes gene_type:complete